MSADKLERLHGELRERVVEGATRLEVPGVAVGVYLGGAEDYVCHGVTSIANPLPLDEHTLFQIGSSTATAWSARSASTRSWPRPRRRTNPPCRRCRSGSCRTTSF